MVFCKKKILKFMNSTKLCLISMTAKTTDINIFKNKTLKCRF